ncbi:hypothetical protein HAX54_011758, partial [Datura stramonium]|nr:hypothetical protein [Datura stramonium]
MVKNIIQEKMIVVKSDPPNVTQNPLPTHNDASFIGMICGEKEYNDSFKSVVAKSSILALDSSIEDGLIRKIKDLLVEEKIFEIDRGSVKANVQTMDKMSSLVVGKTLLFLLERNI